MTEMPRDYLLAEVGLSDSENLRLHVSGDEHMFAADRTVLTPAPYGVNIDNALFLDFDENRYLSGIDFFHMPGDRYKTVAPCGWQSSPRAVIRLAQPPEGRVTDQFDDSVDIFSTADSAFAQAVVGGRLSDSSWYDIGDDVYVALSAGRIASVVLRWHR